MKTTIGDFPVNWLRLFLQTPFRKRGRDVNRSNTSTLDVPLSVTRRCQAVLRRNLTRCDLAAGSGGPKRAPRSPPVAGDPSAALGARRTAEDPCQPLVSNYIPP